MQSEKCKTRNQQIFQEQTAKYPDDKINNSEEKVKYEYQETFGERMHKIQEGLLAQNLGKDDKVFLLQYNHNIFNNCKNQFRQLSDLWKVSDVSWAKIYIVEPSMYNISHNKVQFAVEYLEGYKTVSISQIDDKTFSSRR